MIIVGAGLAGLIAANILREDIDGVFEKQAELPNNHHALLRFRSSIVGDATGIPFKQVTVNKAIQESINPVADAHRYSIKVLGRVEPRSIMTIGGNPTRYIAPPDLVSRLERNVRGKIAYNQSLRDAIVLRAKERFRHMPIISTVPLTELMYELDYPPDREGKLPVIGYTVGGFVLTAELPEEVNVYATVYLPGSEVAAYRASVTGRTLIVEASEAYADPSELPELMKAQVRPVLRYLGLDIYHQAVVDTMTIRQQRYAKISPIPDDVRKRFIQWATDNHNVYSLGRFATWRPGLLLDDIVNDVRVIQRMINGDPSPAYKWSTKS